MRPVVLDLKILLRQLGWLPFVLLAIWCTATWVQEPGFFRLQGLDLLWPSSSVGADLLAYACCCTWTATAQPYLYGLAYTCGPRRAGAALAKSVAALVALSLGVHALAIALCSVLDLASSQPIPHLRVLGWLLRAVLVWLPLSLLTVAAGTLAPRPGVRLAIVTAGFLVLAAVHRVSLAAPVLPFDNVLASALAAAGAAVLAVGTPAARTQ